MSLPCTTMLSLDFLRSRVSISMVALVLYILSITRRHTIAARVQVNHRPYTDVYDSQKALVLLLELLLVKDLNCQNALFVDSPAPDISVCWDMEAGLAA
jgi:hypothetical protein